MTTKPTFGTIVEYVPDLAAARRYYTEVMGLNVQMEAPSFVQFDHFAIAIDEPLGGEKGVPEFYWLVDDAEAAFQELSRKAEVSLALRQEPFGKVFAIKDLFGHHRFVFEIAQQSPSQS
jgi:catechol 2,3-dioxygenase-like lactoylglutathione lyase family enzyme